MSEDLKFTICSIQFALLAAEEESGEGDDGSHTVEFTNQLFECLSEAFYGGGQPSDVTALL
jgi:hypothetical protein